MLKKLFVATAVFTLSLSACGSSKPSDAEIRAALEEQKVNGKGCATSVLFDTMPIKQERVASNQPLLKALTQAGLLEKSGSTFALTSLGKSTYDARVKGFCYTEKYEITNISVVKEEQKSELSGTSLSGAWYVSFTIAPSNVSDWVKSSQLLEMGRLSSYGKASLEKITEPQKYTVRFAKKSGENKLFVADPMFSFRPGIHFNMGW